MHLFDFADDVPNERNTIVYKLHVSCEKGSERLTGISHPPATWSLVQFTSIFLLGILLFKCISSNKLFLPQ